MNIAFICKFHHLFPRNSPSDCYIYNFVRLVDNLPAAMLIENNWDSIGPDSFTNRIEVGYPLGRIDGEKAYINNHLKFMVSYNKSPEWVCLIRLTKVILANAGIN